MSTETTDAIFETDFIKEMVRQVRALDTYGQYSGWPPGKILEPFILTKEKKAEIPLTGDPGDIVVARVKCFY
ncbi:MAG: NifX-associated nitrogen fixation protein, partial [Zoogloeaceae bacterium]|nr:NifX-associated nitrogen fixation protein [Zoogloeaceae bacterium]